jgi:hypothetical protein
MDGNRKEVEEVYAQIYQREVDGAPIEMILEPIAAYGAARYKAGQREAFVAGCEAGYADYPEKMRHFAEAEALRRYPEEAK